VPIVRTFAPFVAGVGRMSYPRFFAYNVVGGIAWVIVCVAAGHKFGSYRFVKEHFELVIVALVIIPALPTVFEVLRARRASKRGFSEIVEATAVGESPSKKMG
jgi:membrane-associated protein